MNTAITMLDNLLSRYRDGECIEYTDLLTLRAAMEQPGVEPVANIEQIAQDRYKVVPSHDSMFYRFAVIAGNGKQQLYLGRETECQNMARKFAGAFLDGAFLSMQSTAPQPAQPDTTELLKQALGEIRAMKTRPPHNDPDDTERGFNAAINRCGKVLENIIRKHLGKAS